MSSLRKIFPLFSLLIIFQNTSAQKNDWFNEDYEESGIMGVSIDRVYSEFDHQPRQEIIVAVIDSGFDIEHEDLKDNIWINSDEVPNNGIDDDENGYIDDVYGWNFLGGLNGNVVETTYETTRIYRSLKPRFDGKSKDEITEGEMEDFELYLETKELTEKNLKSALKKKEELDGFDQSLAMVKNIFEPVLLDKPISKDNVLAIESTNERVKAAKDYMLQLFDNGFNMSEYEEYRNYIHGRALYHYNIEFNDGRNIVGDNPEDPYEKGYGNNDVLGGHAEHGTHVAGIIGAVRNNDKGIKGVASNVKLMCIRAVPDGDERDKDIANAILYAVDNGARVINMSFGKGHSPYKEAVSAAVKYAEENDVLMVHASGNASVNVDDIAHFPTRYLQTENTGPKVETWIEVGAIGPKKSAGLVAEFSNYGVNTVDVFAPGEDIGSTVPGSEYKELSGTSMAAPVVSGVAALVLSYFPELSAVELKQILLDSSVDLGKLKVYLPTTEEKKKKTRFKKLSTTGGVLNAYNAMKLAEKTSKMPLARKQ